MKALPGLILVFSVLANGIHAQGNVFRFWVQLSNKKGTPYSVDRPEEFLSPRAMERRLRYGIPVEWNDLPVNPVYVDSISNTNLRVLYASKWLNGVVAETTDPDLAETLRSWSFVDRVDTLYQPPCPAKSVRNKSVWLPSAQTEELSSDHQIEMLHGNLLHAMGYRGEGMVIALLDTGFEGTDSLPGFDSLYINRQILGTRNFVEPGESVYALSEHGTSVLSIMGGNVPGMYLGSAPAASYWLIQTEDDRSEFHIEEANWLAGAELADSAGADIINSSLGYSDEFTCPAADYTYEDMDGNTALVTMAADLAASKGILVVVSAGNSGRDTDPWQYITAPADGDSVLSVGALNPDGSVAVFSSKGPTRDERIKPDVVAQGTSVSLLRPGGSVDQGNGTSFSAPIIAGLAACLWQNHPEISNYELMETIRRSADMYTWPDSRRGYGKPDFALALDYITGTGKTGNQERLFRIYPNPAKHQLRLALTYTPERTSAYRVLDISGRSVVSGNLPAGSPYADIPLGQIAPGIYTMMLYTEHGTFASKFIKE